MYDIDLRELSDLVWCNARIYVFARYYFCKKGYYIYMKTTASDGG